jgi:hypothetical protein
VGTSDKEWQRVWAAVRRFVDAYPEDVVVIGGIAVFLHARAAASMDLPAEYTHDADLYVSLPSWADIRDTYTVVPNRRLSKHQITVDGVEFDLYLEHNNALRVDYGDLATAAVTLDGARVACLEHLLLLKLAALRERWASDHGQKDRRDVAKLLVLLDDREPFWTLAQATEDDLALIDRVQESSAYLELAGGNAHRAAKLKKRAVMFIGRLKRGLP